MKKNLILYGPIGCGKSTMIKEALGEDAILAGGYVTLRAYYEDQLAGFDLAPTTVLCSRQEMRRIKRFLEFGDSRIQRPEVFEGLGTALLKEAQKQDFAVADEFGGLELLVPSFREELQNLLCSPVPCIGVFKTRDASKSLTRRLGMNTAYEDAYEEMFRFLRENSETEILHTTGWKDSVAREKVLDWVRQYVRK